MKELVVTDATSLIALSRVGQVTLLPSLFRVLAPPAVLREFGSQPDWLDVAAPRDVALVEQLRKRLDAGESEAIALAHERRSRALIDERRGRLAAARMGVQTTGTAGVLVIAKRAGLLAEVGPLLRRMVREESLYLSDDLLEQILRRAGER